MTTCLVIDIETRPDPRLWDDPAYLEQVRAELSAPANYRDPLKIQAYLDEELEKRRNRAALSPTTGKVVAIGFAWLDDEGEPMVLCLDDEPQLLDAFGQILRLTENRVRIGGFNVREFDVPFLTARAAANGVDLPAWWPNRRDWLAIVDPVDLFGRGGSLEDWLRAFGLPLKTGSGAECLTLPLTELAEYCRNDVHVERLFIRRLRDRFPALRADPFTTPTPFRHEHNA